MKLKSGTVFNTKNYLKTLMSFGLIAVLTVGVLVNGTSAIAPGTTTNLVIPTSPPSSPTSTTRAGSITADGRYVYMTTNPSNIVPNDTNGARDAVLRDLTAGTYEHISVSTSGVQANARSDAVDISDDGRYALFFSRGTNVVTPQPMAAAAGQLYLRDRVLGTTEIVSTNEAGIAANRGVYIDADTQLLARISNDGRFVFFTSEATNLVPEVTTHVHTHIYVKDRKLNTLTVLDRSSTGEIANNTSVLADASDDGAYVVFLSFASNLTPDDNNGRLDYFVADLRNDVLLDNLTAGFDNSIANGPKFIKISNNGRYVAFSANSSNIVPGMNGNTDFHLFLYDRFHEIYELLDQSTNGEISDRSSSNLNDSPVVGGISDEGMVVFDARGYNLVPEDTSNVNTGRQVFMRDTQAGTTALISVGNTNVVSPRDARALDISRDGKKVIFTANGADALIPGTSTNRAYIFMRELDG